MRPTYLRPLVIFIGLLMIWQFIIYVTDVPFFILPSPLAVFRSITANANLLVTHSLVTLSEIIAGLFLGVFLGSITAVIMSAFKSIRNWVLPALVVSQTLPVFAIAPILVLWLGYDMASKIAMATIIIYFPITVTFLDGLKNVNQDYIDLARTMDASNASILQFIRIPHALPSFASGVKVATSVAPIGAIVGEWVGASEGLGYLMLHANGRMQTDLMFAALFVLALLAVSLYYLINAILNIVLIKHSLINQTNS